MVGTVWNPHLPGSRALAFSNPIQPLGSRDEGTKRSHLCFAGQFAKLVSWGDYFRKRERIIIQWFLCFYHLEFFAQQLQGEIFDSSSCFLYAFAFLLPIEQTSSFSTSKTRSCDNSHRYYLLSAYYMPDSEFYIHPHSSYQSGVLIHFVQKQTLRFMDEEQRC